MAKFIRTEDSTYRYLNLDQVIEVSITGSGSDWGINMGTSLRTVGVKSGFASEAAAKAAAEALFTVQQGWTYL